MGCISSNESKGTPVVAAANSTAAVEPEKPLPLSVITDAKAREMRIRSVFGDLFTFWDKDRDGWLTAADWAANNQSGQASDSAWIEMTRNSTRGPTAIDKETFLEFYITFYLPKEEAEYRMYLEHWGAAVTALKKQAAGANASNDNKNQKSPDLPRATNGYQPGATSGTATAAATTTTAGATPGTVPLSATGAGTTAAATTTVAAPAPAATATPAPAPAPTPAPEPVNNGLPVATAAPTPISFGMPTL